MARILLVGPWTAGNAGAENWGAPPLGAHRLAAWARKRGHAAEVFDCNLAAPAELEQSWRACLSRKWDIIGFSLLQSTFSETTRRVAEARHYWPNAVILLGGIEATLNPGDCFEHMDCDAVVLGEGEWALRTIADQFERIGCSGACDGVDGVISRLRAAPPNNDAFSDWWMAIDFAAMRYPDYWERTRRLYRDAGEEPDEDDVRTVRLVTSTHCNRGCAFCSVTAWHEAACGKVAPIAYLPPDRLAKLIAKVQAEVEGVRTIYLCEDDAIVNRERALGFFRDYAPQTGLRYLVQTHLHKLLGGVLPDLELIGALAAGGCRHVTLGIENASPPVLKVLGKTQRLECLPGLLDALRAYNIRAYILLIMFPPTATLEDLRINVEAVKMWSRLGATVSCEPHMMCYRGSDLWASDHAMLSEVEPTVGGKWWRYPTRVLPDDPAVREVQREFARRWPERLASIRGHRFKGATGAEMFRLLEEILLEREAPT
jgi:radical SAM superfamily enzyme YgiQ (UPF0313 family)